uniref:Transposase n=1 Tax=Globodera rostochiensis TaxID=31243 RepID=A0A914H854_GLORO
MEELWIFILVTFFATNSLDKAESVQLEELPLQTFDELCVDEWWENDKAEDLKTPPSTNFGQNVHHQIDRQNTQSGQIEPNSTNHLGQIEPNSIDQIGQIEPNSTDQLGQIEPNSTDQNPPLTESDHSDNATNGLSRKTGINYSNDEKLKIVKKLMQIKSENSEKFDQMKAELKRDGFKNSYNHEIDETIAKELGLNFLTLYNWKRELGQSKPQHKYSHSEQNELMKRYYEIKGKNPKMSVGDIAKRLKIGRDTLYRWKRQFKRQQMHPNSENIEPEGLFG